MQTFPLDTMARLLDLSPRRVNQLVAEGIIPRSDRGRYELVPVVQAYIRYLRKQAINADASSFEGEHKRRLLKARADIASMEAERLAGVLVEIPGIEKHWVKLMSFLRQRMLALPNELEEPMVAAKSPEEVHEIYERHVSQILYEVAVLAGNGVPENAAGDQGSLESPDAAAEDDDLAMGGSVSEAVERSFGEAGSVDDDPR